MTEPRVQSVERSIDILMTLAAGPKTLTEVKQETGLSKGTTFRLLASLNYQNLVVKAPTKNLYMLGPGFLRLLQSATLGVGAITAVAKPAVTKLWEATQETVAIHVRIGVERICIDELPSPQAIRYVSTLGSTAPLHVGAAGKVLMAFMEAAEFERAVAALQAVAADEPLDVAGLGRALEDVRRHGWAMSTGERISGAAAVTVPVQGLQGFLASLSVLGPAERLSRQRRLELVPLLRETSTEIERALMSAGERPGPAKVPA